MIVRTRYRGDAELRFGDSSIPRWGGQWSSSALAVSDDTAYGLPAVSSVVRSAAGTIASLSLIVYRDKGERRERATDSWQWQLLHEAPAEECDAFEFMFDIAVSLEASQNAFVQKVKFKGRVVEMYVLDPRRMTVRRDRATGEKRFDYWAGGDDQRRDMTSSEILHIRGFATCPGAIAGTSLITLHRNPLGAGLAMQQFEGDFFRNYSVPPVVLKFGQHVSAIQAREWLDAWNAAHAQYGTRHSAAAIGQGGDIASLPISLEDMLFVETKRLAVEDAARIFEWPKEMLGIGEIGDELQFSTRLLKHYVFPRLRRIERAFAADRDLFPAGRGLFPEFLTASLERADIRTRNESYLRARQAGWQTANEIRGLENMPPHPDGDQLQQTPVGGAPNAAPPSPGSRNGHVRDLALTP